MRIDEQYPDAYDATHTVECYANGKTMQCECGQGNGVPHDKKMWVCATCGNKVIDLKWEDREAPMTDDGQTTLGAWG